MSHISKVTDVITFPARTALGAARLGTRTTGRILGWAAEQVVGRASGQGISVPAPAAPVADAVDTEPDTTGSDVDPMRGTRIPPTKAPAAKAPRKKVPASQVPLKSAPTPSLTPALESFDEADDVPEPTPIAGRAAKKAPAKKTAARKTAAKKAPSKKAAVVAPALGLSESEVAETEEPREASDADRD